MARCRYRIRSTEHRNLVDSAITHSNISLSLASRLASFDYWCTSTLCDCSNVRTFLFSRSGGQKWNLTWRLFLRLFHPTQQAHRSAKIQWMVCSSRIRLGHAPFSLRFHRWSARLLYYWIRGSTFRLCSPQSNRRNDPTGSTSWLSTNSNGMGRESRQRGSEWRQRRLCSRESVPPLAWRTSRSKLCRSMVSEAFLWREKRFHGRAVQRKVSVHSLCSLFRSILEKYQFSPLTDLETNNANGLLRLADDRDAMQSGMITRLAALERDIVAYFRSRHEDSNVSVTPRAHAAPNKRPQITGKKPSHQSNMTRTSGASSGTSRGVRRVQLWTSGPSGTHVDHYTSYPHLCSCPGHEHHHGNHECPCSPNHIDNQHCSSPSENDHHHHHGDSHPSTYYDTGNFHGDYSSGGVACESDGNDYCGHGSFYWCSQKLRHATTLLHCSHESYSSALLAFYHPVSFLVSYSSDDQKTHFLCRFAKATTLVLIPFWILGDLFSALAPLNLSVKVNMFTFSVDSAVCRITDLSRSKRIAWKSQCCRCR